MYTDDVNFTELEKKFIKAFEEFDIDLLSECLDGGMDINSNPNNNFTPSVLSEMLENLDEEEDLIRYENWDFGDIDVNSPIIETDRIKFLKFCIEKGIDLNASYDDCGEMLPLVHSLVRYCYDYNVIKFILSQNINLNTMIYDSTSLLDYLDGEIFCDERGKKDAMATYYQTRLLTYYGAKPCKMLKNNFSQKEKNLHKDLFSFDLEKIKNFSKQDIIEHKLDSYLIDWARFYYPKLWYCETEEFEKQMILVFKEIISKIGVEKISNNVLYECIFQKLPNLLEFLLKAGANPNVNCFTESYNWVNSSALYELYEEGNYFSKELYFRMKKALLDAGATLNGKVPVFGFGHGYCRWES